VIHVMNGERQAASNTLRLEKDRPIKETREAHERLMKIASEVGISAAARIARGPVKKALLQAVAEFDADVLIIGRTSERVSRTIRRLDVCRSQGLAFPRGIWVFDPAYRCGAVPDSHRIPFNVPLGTSPANEPQD
jgi:hypothetical protein